MAASAVDYAAIRADYEFFLGHSTETEAQIAALAPHLTPSPRSMLDFGCGTGAFTASLLVAYPAPRMALSLVEPVATHRSEAASQLAPMVGRIAHVGAELPVFPHHLIVANHSLYYVSDVENVVESLLALRAPDGRLIIALLDGENALARLWRAGFALANLPFPFALADDVEAILSRLGATVRRERITYEVAFPDSTEARNKVLRFLFGDHFDALPDEADSLFARHRAGEQIVIHTAYPHLVVD